MATRRDLSREVTCPDCGAPMVLKQTHKHTTRDGRPKKFYSCSRYPACRQTHGSHPDGTPLGIPASAEVKRLRVEAHAALDRFAKAAGIDRSQQYLLIARLMMMSRREAHISMFDGPKCSELIDRLKDIDPLSERVKELTQAE